MKLCESARRYFFKQHDNLAVSSNLVKEAQRALQNSSLSAADLLLDGHVLAGDMAMKETQALARVCALLEQRKRNEGPLKPADHDFLRKNLKLLRPTKPNFTRDRQVPADGDLWTSCVSVTVQPQSVESSMYPQYAHGVSLRRTLDLLPESER